MTISTTSRPAALSWDDDAGITYRVAMAHFKLSQDAGRQLIMAARSFARSGQSSRVRPIHVNQAVYSVLGGIAIRGYGEALSKAYGRASAVVP